MTSWQHLYLEATFWQHKTIRATGAPAIQVFLKFGTIADAAEAVHQLENTEDQWDMAETDYFRASITDRVPGWN